MQIARLSLENEDPDSAVNRAYYSEVDEMEEARRKGAKNG